MDKLVESIIEFGATAGIKILYALIVLIIGLKLCGWVSKLLKKNRFMSKLENSAKTFLYSFISIGLKILVFIVVAGILGVPMTSFVTMLASAGLAIGLALQGSLSNLAGGFMILIFHPFKVDDFVDISGNMGTVMEINVFYTVLRTADNKHITIPNGTIANANVTNYSSEGDRRVDFNFSVSYEADIEKVKSILLSVSNTHPMVRKDPEPFARLNKHNDSSLDFVLRVWVASADYWTVYFDITEQVKKEFDSADIEIPFPQLDVHTK